MRQNQRAQPKGLSLLFFTELWERFGFYMVQTILVLYLTKGLGFADGASYLLYGAFSSMLYLTPVIGGYIADRFIGFRQSIFLGAFLFLVGYAILFIPHEKALFLGLSIVVIGNGFFKPSVSGILGDLYSDGDPRREGGFTYFYMGINVGSLIPPLFAGALVAAYTWGAGFLVAAMGMVVCILTFALGQKQLAGAGLVPSISPLFQSTRLKAAFYLLLGVGIFVSIAVLYLLLYYPLEANLILIIASLGTIGAILFFLFNERPAQRKKMVVCLILIGLSIGFWAIYNQTFTSLMLFADRNMTKELLGFPIDAEFTQFFNPLFIVLLSPFLSRLWIRLDEEGKNPSTPLKFALGIFCMSLGFLGLGGALHFFHAGGNGSPWWLIGSYFIQTIGELLISPIGLAMVTRLAPRHLIGMMMGVWFLTQAAAFAIGGGLATLADVPKEVTGEASLAIYTRAFFVYGGLSLVLALLSFALVPYLKRLIGSTTGITPTPKL